MSEESPQGAPEEDASPGGEETDASAPDVIVIMVETFGLVILLPFNCCAYCTILTDTLKMVAFRMGKARRDIPPLARRAHT